MVITSNDKSSTRAERKTKKRKLEDAIPNLPGDTGFEEIQNTSKRRHDKTSKIRSPTNDDAEDVIDNSCHSHPQKAGKKEKKPAISKQDFGSNGQATDLNATKKTKSTKLETARYLDGYSDEDTMTANIVLDTMEGDRPPKKSKKERKAARKAIEAGQAAQTAEITTGNDAPSVPVLDSLGTDGVEPVVVKSRKNNRNREKKRKVVRGNGTTGTGEVNDTKDEIKAKAVRFICFIGQLGRSTCRTHLISF